MINITIEVSKEEKRSMKRFSLDKKEDFRIYLYSLIGRTDKCITQYKKYLQRMSKYIEVITDGNSTTQNNLVIPYDVYSEYIDLLSNVQSYILNLIGDSQENSMSYKKFRDIISKRKKRGTLDFEIKELDEDIIFLINDLNKMRNWINHVPESLLMSEMKLISERHLGNPTPNPINIHYHEFCTFELFEDLLNSSQKFYEVARSIHQSMKKDYASIIGESVEIKRIYSEKAKDVDHLEAARLSSIIQGIKGTSD